MNQNAFDSISKMQLLYVQSVTAMKELIVRQDELRHSLTDSAPSTTHLDVPDNRPSSPSRPNADGTNPNTKPPSPRARRLQTRHIHGPPGHRHQAATPLLDRRQLARPDQLVKHRPTQSKRRCRFFH